MHSEMRRVFGRSHEQPSIEDCSDSLPRSIFPVPPACGDFLPETGKGELPLRSCADPLLFFAVNLTLREYIHLRGHRSLGSGVEGLPFQPPAYDGDQELRSSVEHNSCLPLADLILQAFSQDAPGQSLQIKHQPAVVFWLAEPVLHINIHQAPCSSPLWLDYRSLAAEIHKPVLERLIASLHLKELENEAD